MTTCPVCGEKLSAGLRPWHRVCATCGYEGSELNIDIFGHQPGEGLNEKARETALETLRHSNFRRLLAEINRLRLQRSFASRRPRLLDVGSAHGWFLALAREHYDVVGVEPDKGMLAAIRAKGLAVREGFFPTVLNSDESFDVIVFNDVLEHIPDVDATFRACADHLTPDGLLVVNAPNRSGFIYWVSKQLLRIGYPGIFDRLWQYGFPSPHVHYFNSASIERLAARHGFLLLDAHRLPSVSIAGLYSRVRYSRDVSPAQAVFLVPIISAAIPALAILPPDIKVWFLAKQKIGVKT